LQLDFRLFCSLSWSAFSALPTFIFFLFFFYFFGKKNEFWGITQNWVMTQLSANYEQLRQMVMNMASQSGDTCAPPLFWPYNN